MENNVKHYKVDHVLDEAPKVDLNAVKTQREWVFWENYEAKSGEKLAWEESIEQVFEFGDIIMFWQFWNRYPGSNVANIFYNGERLR